MAYALAALVISAWIVTGMLRNNRLATTAYRTTLAGLRAPLRVVHLSDLHGKRFGPRDEDLLSAVGGLAPDLIAFSGDVLNRRRNVTVQAIAQLRALCEIAPVVVCRGNHDLDHNEWSALVQAMSEAVAAGRLSFLRDEVVTITIGDNTVSVAGVEDPAAYGDDASIFQARIDALSRRAAAHPRPRILLAHRPEYIARYVATSFQLSLSGHAHGGQVRLPLIGALWAPKQGLLPRHSDGIHRIGSLTAVVSRGLATSGMPPRFHNPPEIVTITCVPPDA